MTAPISSTQPTFVMVQNSLDKPKAVKVENIASLDTVPGAVVLKDVNDKLLGRIDTNSTPEDIAKQFGNILDIQA